MRFSDEPIGPQDILEKPRDKEDNMRMLLDLNGAICEVVTGVSIGTLRLLPPWFLADVVHFSAFPVLEAPGYKIK